MWRSPGQSISQQEIKAIYPSTLRMMCVVLISVIFCSSMTDGWPGSNLRFWSNPFLIVPNAPIGTIFVLTFHILLTWISRYLYSLSFSLSFVLKFVSSAMATSITRQVFSFLSCTTVPVCFASIVRPLKTGKSHTTEVPLTFRPFQLYVPGIYFSVTWIP